MSKLWYTAYVVLSLTWLGLLYVEWQVPGFVSQVFPLYIILIAATVCGIASVVQTNTAPHVDIRLNYFIASIAGLLLAAVMVKDGEVFGAFRFILALVLLCLPMVMVRILNQAQTNV